MISFIVPTIGRLSLLAALDSIEVLRGDEVLVIGPSLPLPEDTHVRHIQCETGNDWGRKERTLGMAEARGDYLAFLDDDDRYAQGTRQLMEDAIQSTPGRPVLFRMQYPDQSVLWADPELRCGNVSTCMILIPNHPDKLGRWTVRREGDYDFLASMKWARNEIVWRSEIIALMGHNDA